MTPIKVMAANDIHIQLSELASPLAYECKPTKWKFTP